MIEINYKNIPDFDYENKYESGLIASCKIYQSGDTLATEIKNNWIALQEHSNCSLFLRWTWIGSWLKVVMKNKPVMLFKLSRNDSIISMGIFVYWEEKHISLCIRNLALNELTYGIYNVFIEKNGLLNRKGDEVVAYKAFLDFLVYKKHLYDRLHITALNLADYNILRKNLPGKLHLDTRKVEYCWEITGNEYDEITSSGHYDFLHKRLSKNRIYQVKRFIKLLNHKNSDLGRIMIKIDDISGMLQAFEKLNKLHTSSWNQRGMRGAFCNDLWIKFQHEIIRQSINNYGFKASILAFKSEKEEFAYLYNFEGDNEAYNIQSAFTYHDDNKWRPGYFCHLFAAGKYIKNKFRKYDLLVGDETYKSSVSVQGDKLTWLELKPHGLWLYLDKLAGIRRILRIKQNKTNSSLSKRIFENYVVVILATGINGLGAIRSAHLAGLKVITISTNANSIIYYSGIPVKKYLVSNKISNNDELLLEYIVSLDIANGILVPTSDRYAEFIQNNNDKLSEYFRIVTPPNQTTSILNDKKFEYEEICKHDIPLPGTVTDLSSSISKLSDILRFPIIIKPRRYKGYKIIDSKNIIIKNNEELEEFKETFFANLDELIAQSIIQGGDDNLWVCNATFDKNYSLVSCFIFRRHGLSPPHYGVTSLAVSEENMEIMDLAAKLGYALNYIGPCMFEFKYCSNENKYVYIETNPRLGMCNWFDTRCGVNNVEALCAVALDNEYLLQKVRSKHQRNGVVYINFFNDIYARLVDEKKLMEIFSTYKILLGKEIVFAIFWYRDIAPFLLSVIHNIKFVFKSIAKRFSQQGK